ncbi:Os05g0194550, partial [Oryza sativa Japonica Group]
WSSPVRSTDPPAPAWPPPHRRSPATAADPPPLPSRPVDFLPNTPVSLPRRKPREEEGIDDVAL